MPSDTDVSVETFLPITNEHQEIVRESVLSGQLQFDDQSSEAGRNGLWTGEGASEIRYRALISTRRVVYDLDETLQIVEQHPAKMEPYLVAAEGIQLGHPEIEEAWVSIQPEAGRELVPVLRSIYEFTYGEIESTPFKGFTDALTALRLRQACCNDKGRLFVALVRRNRILSTQAFQNNRDLLFGGKLAPCPTPDFFNVLVSRSIRP